VTETSPAIPSALPIITSLVAPVKDRVVALPVPVLTKIPLVVKLEIAAKSES